MAKDLNNHISITPVDGYEIDYDKVNTIDDIKLILKALGISFSVPISELKHLFKDGKEKNT